MTYEDYESDVLMLKQIPPDKVWNFTLTEPVLRSSSSVWLNMSPQIYRTRIYRVHRE